MKKNLIALMILLIGFLITPNKYFAQDKEWTFLVYLVGADLESQSEAGTSDIIEMLSAGLTENINIIVLTGGANKEGWLEPTAWSFESGNEIILDYSANGLPMSSPENVTSFINWSLERYPAKKVSLTFWNHGGDIRGFGWDEISNDNLKVPQLHDALANTNFIIAENKFEVLGFDACLMGNIETVSTLGKFCNWYIGSEEQEPGHGWNYTPIIETLNNSETEINGDSVGRVVVDGFFAQANAEVTTALTLSVMDPTKISALEVSLDTLFKVVTAENKISKLHKARAQAQEYSKAINNPEYSEDMVDIGDMMKKLRHIDTTLTPLIDTVLAKLNDAVVYTKHDMARPGSTGMSMYLPHNVLVDENELFNKLDSQYYPIDFSVEIRNFVYDNYSLTVISDDSPPDGAFDSDFDFLGKGSDSQQRSSTGEVSAMRVTHNDDLEQVQILLIEELVGFPDEYIMLGSTHPDTIVYGDSGTDIFAYKWDELWLGINGHPAYISDIQDYEVADENGNITQYTRIHIPAVRNVDQPNQEFLILTYSYDEDFNYELESIIPEPYTDDNGNMIVPKRRISLQPGEQIQLLYEGFNEATDEEFFLVDDDAIITIETGNEDLVLEYDKLEVGNYQLAYLLEDHSKNDTLIFDPTIYTVMASGIESVINNNNFSIVPNPASHSFNVEINDLGGSEYKLQIVDVMGRLVHSQASHDNITTLSLNLANGIYTVEIIIDNQRIVDRLVIQK